jgi:hypothetical protein
MAAESKSRFTGAPEAVGNAEWAVADQASKLPGQAAVDVGSGMAGRNHFSKRRNQPSSLMKPA